MSNISLLKNKEFGKRCFILANGPSINNLDLSKLKREIVIGMNASPLLEKSNSFKHSYYTISDTRFLTENEDKYDIAVNLVDESVMKVFRKEIYKFYPNKRNTHYVQALERDGFSENLKHGYYYGRTTVMLALQLAYYLGCSEIYLLGFDLTYSHKQARFYVEKKMQIDDAQASIQIWNIHQAYLFLQSRGIKLYQCNKNSLARNYIPFCNFEDIFN
ncbi:hypothetical protein GCM10007161_06110 [Ignatzschineria indica]|uniref:6-hydroxymethylpterin diphosphokinase MptE-like domain-containing protein n=1 Tax=Ignatzschineria indica TaxID=472583 RepID=A0A2U2AN37_9GAMM|nr:6-hydroxymethylpterin diphosphokinase MptE-like protein [Ignatzschineria indica]PWD84585.1 hypothetical protein DC082_03370 [Ignatzschineria indica]GGZ77670.1 hypothetical protein GCM10007161_06110 [Ignatzschineria indica]